MFAQSTLITIATVAGAQGDEERLITMDAGSYLQVALSIKRDVSFPPWDRGYVNRAV